MRLQAEGRTDVPWSTVQESHLTMEILLTLNTLTIILSVVAIYRITALVIDDRVFDRPRDWIHSKLSGRWIDIPYLITCYWCLSFWVGLVCLPFMLFLPFIWGPLALVLTASAVSGILSTVVMR